MTGFELQTSGVGSNHSANWDTATAQTQPVLANQGDLLLSRLVPPPTYAEFCF